MLLILCLFALFSFSNIKSAIDFLYMLSYVFVIDGVIILQAYILIPFLWQQLMRFTQITNNVSTTVLISPFQQYWQTIIRYAKIVITQFILSIAFLAAMSDFSHNFIVYYHKTICLFLFSCLAICYFGVILFWWRNKKINNNAGTFTAVNPLKRVLNIVWLSLVSVYLNATLFLYLKLFIIPTFTYPFSVTISEGLYSYLFLLLQIISITFAVNSPKKSWPVWKWRLGYGVAITLFIFLIAKVIGYLIFKIQLENTIFD